MTAGRDTRPLSQILYERAHIMAIPSDPIVPSQTHPLKDLLVSPVYKKVLEDYFATVYKKALPDAQSGLAFPRGRLEPSAQDQEHIPGFESVQAPAKSESRRRVVNDPETELAGLTDDPCPWEWVSDGVYFNVGTGETFEWSGQGAGILTTPGDVV